MNGQKKICSRVAVVDMVSKFLDIETGKYFYLHVIRKFDDKNIMGVEINLVATKRLLRRGNIVKLVISRRD